MPENTPQFAIIFHISNVEIAIDIIRTNQFIFKNYPIYCSVVQDLVDENFLKQKENVLHLNQCKLIILFKIISLVT